MSGELTLPCPACNGDGFVLHENRLTETNKTSCKVCSGYGTIPANTGMTPESSAPADPVERRHTRVLRDDTPVFEHRGHDVNTISRREGLGPRGADPELSRINQEVELSRPEALAEGCCSSISPCAHQRSDPSTLCDVCQDAADSVFVAKTLVMTDAEVVEAIRAEGRDPDKVVEESRSALSATIDMFRRMTTAEAKLHQIYSQYIVNRGDMTAEQALKAIEYICTRVDK